jgi:rod shape-determining protein MreD
MDYRRRRLDEHLATQVGLALLVLALTLIQTTLLPSVLQSPLNLVLIATICWTMISGPAKGAAIAFYGGLVLDLLAHSPLGSHALALLVVAGITAVVVERLPAENWLLTLILVGVGTPLYHLIVIGLNGGVTDWLSWLIVVIPPAIVINLVLSLPELMIIRWWHERHNAT